MLEHLRHGTITLFRHDSWRPVEWVFALILTILGIWLWLPTDTFASSAAYRSMQVLTPPPLGEWTWALGFTLIGGYHLWSIHTGERYRGGSLALLQTCWLLILLITLPSTLRGAAAPAIYAVYFGSLWWASHRLKEQIREVR